jgi:hypothetical protein
MSIEDKDLPGLYQIADSASQKEQRKYLSSIIGYLCLLIVAALFAYFSADCPDPILKIISSLLFGLSLCIMIWQRVSKPDDTWYNGRVVAESVKTRSWRWMMRAEPYADCEQMEIMRKHFINDLKTILKQNESLIGKLGIEASIKEPISEKMIQIRSLSIEDRFKIYRTERITNQALWYTQKAKYNKKQSFLCLLVTIGLHLAAIILLLYNIKEPHLKLPIDILAVGASSALTWIQSKKFNELSSSYSLTAHEITLMRAEATFFSNENAFSTYIMNCENAFSREHTQWFARNNE